MSMKKVLAFMMTLAVVGTVGAPAVKAEAAGLTQAADASQVAYGSLTDDDVALLQVLFDYDYYKSQNPDLVEALGDDYTKLFEHFCTCGIFEGRSCNPGFDPSAYASAYSDLKEAFGSDIMKYYEHYMTVGLTENRTITTLEAAARAGITVHPLNNESINITPEIYRIAKALGATSMDAVTTFAESVAKAQARNAAVVVTTKEPDEVTAKAQGLTKIGTISLGEGNLVTQVYIYIAEGKQGYAAYEVPESSRTYDDTYYNYQTWAYVSKLTVDSVPIYVTDDYVPYTKEELGNEDGSIVDTIIGEVSYYVQVVPSDVTSSENTVAGDPHYKTLSQSDSEWPSGILAITDVHDYYDTGKYVTKETESSYCFEGEYVLDGSYTDSDGNWKAFENAEEKYEYLEEKTTTEVTEWGSSYVSSIPDEMSPKYNVDRKGTVDTKYDMGMEITKNDDGNLNIVVGISNADNEYGYVTTSEYSYEITTNN